MRHIYLNIASVIIEQLTYSFTFTLRVVASSSVYDNV